MAELLACLAGLAVGIAWGEHGRRQDLLFRQQFGTERPIATTKEGLQRAVAQLRDTLAVVSPEARAPDIERELSAASIARATEFLRAEAASQGVALPPEEARRQAELMLAGEDV